MNGYYTEMIVSGSLVIFAMLFKFWLTQLTKSLDKIVNRLDSMHEELHEHKLSGVKVWARVEADVRTIYKRLDRECEPHNG